MTRLTQLVIADDPSPWQGLGLGGVQTDGRWHLAAGPVGVVVDPGGWPSRRGIVAWGLDRAVESVPELGVEFMVDEGDHPGAAERLRGIDHVVLMTASLEHTCGLIDRHLEAPLKRIREAGGGVRQGFHRLGDVIVEVVETPQMSPGPAHCWGFVFTVDDVDALIETWGEEVVGAARPAVQPGRRIASLRRGAGLATAVAFLSPPPSVNSPE